GVGAGTPRQRGQISSQSRSPAPRTATVVRRTAVFKPTQPVDPNPKGRPPRGAGHGRRSSASSVPGGAGGSIGTHPSRHQRTSSTPSGHRRGGSGARNSGGSGALFPRSSRGVGGAGAGSGGSGRPPSAPSSRGRGGGDSGAGGFPREMKDLSPPPPPREKGERFPAPLSAPSALAGAAKKPARSLMFTSAARKRAGSGDASRGGGGGSAAASPQSVIPPSPSGSSLSGFSAIGSSIAGGGEAHSRRLSLERGFGLTLPQSIAEATGAHPPVSVVTVTPKSRGRHAAASPIPACTPTAAA
ncbi:unnamed protein product, partial [Scytosiphon promiscuus]